MGALGIDLSGILWQLVAFGLLVFGLYKLMYKPTLSILDERAEQVRLGMENAELARRRAEEAQVEFDRMIEQARRKSQEAVAESARSGEKVRQEIVEQARQDSARLIQDARQVIENEQRQALATVRDEIVDLSMEATRRVLQGGMDEDLQRRLIEQFLSETSTEEPDAG